MDRSVPFVMGEGTCLRLDRADIKAIENELGIGYPHFIRDGIFGSLTANEAFVWRGLRKENQKGELEHVFPLNPSGKEQAGNAIMEYLQGDGTTGDLNRAVMDTLFTCGLFKRTKPEDKNPDAGDAPKNSTT